MPSSYTPSLRLVLPVTGELQGTWGDTVNQGLTNLVEAAIAGTAVVSMTDANYTLTVANEAPDEARQMFVRLTGTLSASRNVVCPSVSKLYFVTNATTGGQSIVFKTAAGSGITIPNGASMMLYCDGTNVLSAISRLQADVVGNVTGTVTNGVYTTGNQTIGGVKTFSDRVNGKTSGTDATPAFFASTTGGAYATMWTRRGSPFYAAAATTGSSYAPALSHEYAHNSAYSGVYSVGVLNLNAASPGAFAIHHLNSSGTQDYAWLINGSNGGFTSPGNVTATAFIGDGSQLTGVSAVPAGAVIYVAMNSAPTGYLKANGAAVSRTTYAALFAAIGTTYGAGDGSTTFQLPDLRGEFVRGWDDGRGVDSGRAIGSAQAHQMQSHTHIIQTISGEGGFARVISSVGGAGAIHSTDATGGTSNSSENRPRNVALLACIKF